MQNACTLEIALSDEFLNFAFRISSQNVNLSQYFGILVINVTVTVGAFVLFGTVTTEAPVTQIIINQ